MHIMKKLAVVVFSLGLGGCGPMEGTDLGGDDIVSQIERDFGGPNGLMDFFESSTEVEIQHAMAQYGVGYTVEDVTQDAISDCVKYFPSGDRNVWKNFDGEYYYIEGYGRPYRAYKYLPPISAAPRIDSCQTNVGQWGDAEDPSNDYDGGHMIGSQLGGYGGRANLVPQDANFNRGNWLQLENKMAACGGLPSGRIRYYIGVGYSNSTKLVPGSFTMELTNQSSGSSVSLAFTNVDYGGSNGTSERTRGVNWLTSQGCN